MGGRTSPAGYPSLMPFGSGRCVWQLSVARWMGVGRSVGMPWLLDEPHANAARQHLCCRLSFGGSSTPVGEPTSQSRPPLGSANRKVHSASPGKRQLQAGSPVPQSPLLSPSKVR